MEGYENNKKDARRFKYHNECAFSENGSEESEVECEETQHKTPQKTPGTLKKSSNEAHQSVILYIQSVLPYILGLVALLGCISLIPLTDMVRSLPPLDVSRYDTQHLKALKDNIKNIRKEFPSQVGDVWPAFAAGIRHIQEDPTTPSVFLLIHENEEETPACLAWKISKIALKFLNATVQKPLILDGTDIEHDGSLLKDYGKLIDDNRHKVEKSHIMIVHNLHKIPAVVAQSFHAFCDTVTPLVDKALYFFTMKAPGANHASGSPTKLAEKELKRLWSNDLDNDVLVPLITRITDTTMLVKPESDISSSCQR